MAQSMAEPTQPISLGEQTKRGLWWRFLNLFSRREPELPTTVQSEKPKQPFPPIQERPTEPENTGFTPVEDRSTIAMKIEEQPKEAKRVTFIFQTQPMKGEGSIIHGRKEEQRGRNPTVGVQIDEYILLITTSIKDKKIKELMPAKDSKEPLTMRQARESGKEPTHFLIKPNAPKTLFIFGTSSTADIVFGGMGSASIGDFSADIWAGVNDKGELEYFLRAHEPSWSYDETTQRCLKTDESIPIVPGKLTDFWVGRVGVDDDLKPAFLLSIKIQEQ